MVEENSDNHAFDDSEDNVLCCIRLFDDQVLKEIITNVFVKTETNEYNFITDLYAVLKISFIRKFVQSGPEFPDRFFEEPEKHTIDMIDYGKEFSKTYFLFKNYLDFILKLKQFCEKWALNNNFQKVLVEGSLHVFLFPYNYYNWSAFVELFAGSNVVNTFVIGKDEESLYEKFGLCDNFNDLLAAEGPKILIEICLEKIKYDPLDYLIVRLSEFEYYHLLKNVYLLAKSEDHNAFVLISKNEKIITSYFLPGKL